METLEELMTKQRSAGRVGRSGVRHVFPSDGGFRVRITHRGKSHSFGVYEDLETAAKVARLAEERLASL